MKTPSHTVLVAVGLLLNADGTILVCQRPPDGRYPGKWEFPGGKVEFGESPEGALVRELREELSIEAAIGPLYHRQTARYDDGGSFDVYYFLVRSWRGDLRNNLFADLQWVGVDRLADFELLEGNREICRLLAQEGIALQIQTINSPSPDESKER